MSTKLELLISYCSENDRVCPLPIKWDKLWKMLPNRSSLGGGWEPAPPLILAAWHDTPALLKKLRLKGHLEWAEQHGSLDPVDKFLRELPEMDWHHWGD